MRGDYAAAVEAGRRAMELNPLFSSTYKSYLAALGWMGREREAKEVLRRLLYLEPGFSLAQAVARSPFLRPEDIARYAEGCAGPGLRSDGFAAVELPIIFGIDLAAGAQHSPARIAR